MPWTAKDAKSHTGSANTSSKQRQWAHIANNILAKTGNEAKAIQTANGVVSRNAIKRRLTKKVQ